MWINLIGMSDVNSDSSDTDSTSVAMSPTATLLRHQLIHVNLCFHLYFPSQYVIPFPTEGVFNSAT